MIRSVLVAVLSAATMAGGLAVAPGAVAQASDPVLVTADLANSWQVSGEVFALEHVNGVVFAGGRFDSIRPSGAPAGTGEVSRDNFAAFDAETGDPLACAVPFTHTAGDGATVRSIKASPDGSRIYVGGFFNRVGDLPAGGLASIDVDSCEPTAGFNLARMDGNVRSIDTTETAVYVAGDFTTVDSTFRPRYAVLDPDGQLLPPMVNLDAVAYAVLAAEDVNRVYIGGAFDYVNGEAVHGLVAVNIETGRPPTFPNWIPSRARVKGFDRDENNFYLAAEGNGGGVFDGRLAATIDTGELLWKDTCLGATQAVLEHRGIVYGASHAHDCSSTEGGFREDGFRQHLTAQYSDTGVLEHWWPDTDEGIGERLGPRALVMAGEDMWVGGEFTQFNYLPQQGIARISGGPDTDVPQVPQLRAETLQAGRVLLSWRTTFDRDDPELTYELYRDGQLINTQTAASQEWYKPMLSFMDQAPAGQTVGYRLRVLEPDGDLVSTWDRSFRSPWLTQTRRTRVQCGQTIRTSTGDSMRPRR